MAMCLTKFRHRIEGKHFEIGHEILECTGEAQNGLDSTTSLCFWGSVFKKEATCCMCVFVCVYVCVWHELYNEYACPTEVLN